MSNVCISVPSATLSVSKAEGVALPAQIAMIEVPHLCEPLVAASMLSKVQSLYTFTGRQKSTRGSGTSILRSRALLFAHLGV